jgi:predicted phosphate transport protein (TIGR00153 family)
MKVFDFFLRKQRLIENYVFDYLEQWEKCLEDFKSAMDVYLTEGLGEKFDYYVEHTHKMESRADDLRKKIEWEMYSKALLPESRGDILGFLETMDKIPNKAESILYQIQLEKLRLPEELTSSLRRIVDLICQAIQLVYEAAKGLISQEGDIHQLADRIDDKESECDHAERDIIARIFAMDIDTAEKALLKELIIELGTLTDRAENVSDRLTLLSVKRRV